MDKEEVSVGRVVRRRGCERVRMEGVEDGGKT